MNKDFIIDYLGCILLKLFGSFIRILPVGFGLFLGRRLGDLLYYFDVKHKAVAYANIKTAFGAKLTPGQLSTLTREFYRSLGESLMEVFFIPLVDKEYINRHVSIEGFEVINETLKSGKGLILLGVHSGSWELSNIISANFGLTFSIFVRDQRHPRLNNLLNSYRIQRGCKIIQRTNQTRHLIEALKNNEAIGMTIDQGGRTGCPVTFFGKTASMASGAVRLALKFDTPIVPAFYTRIKGPFIKVILEPPVKIKKTGNKEVDMRDNVQEIVSIFERHINKYPKDYLWSYKIWKHSNHRDILILDDARTGHLRQSQAVAGLISDYLKERQIDSSIFIQDVKFRNFFSKNALILSSCFAGKYHCQGCLWCLRTFLERKNYKSLISRKADIIISCGSSVACVNYVLSRENQAKSIVVTRPSILSTKRFDLVVMPRHDQPPKRKNVVVTEGALNLIDEQYLDNCVSEMAYRISKENDKRLAISDKQVIIGLLIGGDTKNFRLTKEKILEVISQIKSASEKLNADILATTSRRTSKEAEGLLKKELQDYPRCKLLVIANEKNIPEAVGGILGLSSVVIASPESISMVSEAVSSKKYVLVFQESGLNRKHRIFIDYFAKNRYIYLSNGFDLSERIQDVLSRKPKISILKDNRVVMQALSRIL